MGVEIVPSTMGKGLISGIKVCLLPFRAAMYSGMVFSTGELVSYNMNTKDDIHREMVDHRAIARSTAGRKLDTIISNDEAADKLRVSRDGTIVQ